ncbi:MAG: hypothetical protein H6707_00325 [Deltaproteobacteria bacterium]|nr:hypothetical protein [Deltaproteobacteria bacterium]
MTRQALIAIALFGVGCNRAPIGTQTDGAIHDASTLDSASGSCSYNGRTYKIGDGFKSTDGCNDCSCGALGVACTQRACIDGSIDGSTFDAGAPDAGSSTCVVAYNWGVCCPRWEAVRPSAVAANPCLSEYPARELPANCSAPACPATCARLPPLSRVAAPLPAGGCSFASECQTPSDCTLAKFWDVCCDCPATYPSTLVAQNECLASQPPAKCSPATPCPSCAACPSIAQPSCVGVAEQLLHNIKGCWEGTPPP